jgi:hypothetical protein
VANCPTLRDGVHDLDLIRIELGSCWETKVSVKAKTYIRNDCSSYSRILIFIRLQCLRSWEVDKLIEEIYVWEQNILHVGSGN